MQEKSIPRTVRVLLLDDDHLQLQYYASIVEEAGFEVHLANTSREALGILRLKAIDLVISDLRMPGANGIDFISYVRKNQIASDSAPIPIIILSCDDLSPVETAELQANGYCAKREADFKLVSVIRECIEKGDATVF